MLKNLANYLLKRDISALQNSCDDSNNKSLDTFSLMSRFNQVEVEGDEWILIDRGVEGTTALEESWYVMPPACFTQAGPVNVETSPLENLLIEHPSMSVYRATASPVIPDTPPATSDATEEQDVDENVAPKNAVDSPPLSLKRRIRPNKKIRRLPFHDGIPAARIFPEKVQTVQLRSAQKVFEKRSSQALKGNRLERSNKVREVASTKGRRPRRQDRLRIQNSGANNNRKC